MLLPVPQLARLGDVPERGECLRPITHRMGLPLPLPPPASASREARTLGSTTPVSRVECVRLRRRRPRGGASPGRPRNPVLNHAPIDFRAWFTFPDILDSDALRRGIPQPSVYPDVEPRVAGIADAVLGRSPTADLAQINRPTPEVLQALGRELLDEDQWIGHLAAKALRRLGTPETLAQLQK